VDGKMASLMSLSVRQLGVVRLCSQLFVLICQDDEVDLTALAAQDSDEEAWRSRPAAAAQAPQTSSRKREPTCRRLFSQSLLQFVFARLTWTFVWL
jgi:hypothetical protein